MRIHISTVFLTITTVGLTLSCNQKEELTVKEYLEGTWRLDLFDTVSIASNFADINTSKWDEYWINTDSGCFKHTYNADTLTEIVEVEYRSLTEFQFETDSTGFIIYHITEEDEIYHSDELGEIPDEFEVIELTQTTGKLRIIPSHLLSPREITIELSRDSILITDLGETWKYKKVNKL